MKDKHGLFELTTHQKQALVGIIGTDALNTVYDIMEHFCDQSENEFIGTPPSSEKEVLAAHAVMHAQRIYMQKVIKYIDDAVHEVLAVPKSPEELREELMAKIHSVVPETEF